MNDNDIDADPEMVFLCGIMGFALLAVFSRLIELHLYVYAIPAGAVGMMCISVIIATVERKIRKKQIVEVLKG